MAWLVWAFVLVRVLMGIQYWEGATGSHEKLRAGAKSDATIRAKLLICDETLLFLKTCICISMLNACYGYAC